MKTYRRLTVTPDYAVDEFVTYVLKLPELVPAESTRDPLAVHGKRMNSEPKAMELVELDDEERSLNYIGLAELLDLNDLRPADYGELKGFWQDSIPERPVVIIPSKEDLTKRVNFEDLEENPIALLVIKPRGRAEAAFAVTRLTEKPLESTMLFLVTKK